MALLPWNGEVRDSPERVAHVVRSWVTDVTESPLYEYVGLRLADDPAMLDLVARIDNTPPLNLLFGAVKQLVTPSDPLAAWYPHVGGDADLPLTDEAYGAFRALALAHVEQIVHIGATRRTQTNEVGRAAVMLPWIAEAAARWDEPPHLIDVGASAGLNLCLDRFDYDYDYGSVRLQARTPASTRVTLPCDVHGDVPLPDAVPAIAGRLGIDLMPVDATDPEQASWLEALIWPSQLDRIERLRAAIEIRRETDATVATGDAAEDLARLAATLPDGPVIVMHSVMAYQLTPAQRAAIDDAVVQIARERPVARVALEPLPSGITVVTTGLTRAKARVRAHAHPHGAWLRAV